jgi:hypothetical protein
MFSEMRYLSVHEVREMQRHLYPGIAPGNTPEIAYHCLSGHFFLVVNEVTIKDYMGNVHTEQLQGNCCVAALA